MCSVVVEHSNSTTGNECTAGNWIRRRQSWLPTDRAEQNRTVCAPNASQENENAGVAVAGQE